MNEFKDQIFAYYFDIPFEETLNRHQQKPNAHEFGEKEMIEWWNEKDLLDIISEVLLYTLVTLCTKLSAKIGIVISNQALDQRYLKESIFHIHGIKPAKIERFQCQLYGKLILLLLSSTVMFKMRTLVLENKELETSEIKASEIVHEYIDRLYFELIKFPSETFNTLKLVFEIVIFSTVYVVFLLCHKIIQVLMETYNIMLKFMKRKINW